MPPDKATQRTAANKHEEIEKSLACIKIPDMNKTPWTGRLIRPWLAGFAATDDRILLIHTDEVH